MTEHTADRPQVTIYTDGGCRPNPGPGAWAAILRCDGNERILSGNGVSRSTNNQMELTAVTEALRALTRACEVTIYTDSQYVQRGITEWLPNWQQNNWRASNRRRVKNQALWQALVAATAPHEIHWVWVAGHSGHIHNEHAHRLVREQLHSSRRLSPTRIKRFQEHG